MHIDEQEAIRLRIMELRVEHRDLDAAIMNLTQSGYQNQIQITRLKKRKLFLKDMISKLESQLIPDLNA